MKKKSFKSYKNDLNYINKKLVDKIDEYIDRNRKLLKKDFWHYPDSHIENLLKRDCMYLFKLRDFILTELTKETKND